MASGSASDVGRQVEKAMARTSKALKAAVKAGMADSGKIARREVEGFGKRYTGGDLRFSNMGGARLGVRMTGVEDGLLVSAKGPWGMLQPGAKAHTIGTTGKSMSIGGGLFRRGPFNHPGTPNTRAWDMGREATFDTIESSLLNKIASDVEGAF